ncbi:MAG TPA: PAS domain S-box protein, partial [Flavisolibacter sp.]
MTQRKDTSISSPAVQDTHPQEQLRQAQQLLDQSPAVICTINAEGRFQFVSAAAKKVWGYKPNELQGVAFRNLLVPEDREEIQRKVEALVKEGNTGYFQNRFIRKDAKTVKMAW